MQVAVRAHTELANPDDKKPWTQEKDENYSRRILVFDTETTTDEYQNLRFGQAFIVEKENVLVHEAGNVRDFDHILFYGDDITPEELKVMQEWKPADKWAAMPVLMHVSEFVKKVLLPELAINKTICVGFNLLFDLTRIAIGVKTRTKGKHKDEFELVFDDIKDNRTPTIFIKPKDAKSQFIKLGRAKNQGWFLDLRQLVFALTNQSMSLKRACQEYATKHQKTEADSDGYEVITPTNLEYNYQDVYCTFDLYGALMQEYDNHPVSELKEAGRIYSPAGMGKAYYECMNIQPLSVVQPDFPKVVLGYAMVSYYGGRAECHYRKEPVKAYHTDVLSMYPSVFVLQKLWNWVIADGFSVKDDKDTTQEIKGFVSDLTFDDLFSKETWLKIPGLVLVKPNKNLLPVRADYKNHKQIGLNYLTSTTPMWYTLADVIACKILTGETPEIIKGIRIIPNAPQPGLDNTFLRNTIPINPGKIDFFKKVIELRKEFKAKKKQAKKDGDKHLETESENMQMFLKILANSTSYGAYVELNREDLDNSEELNIYGLDNFTVSAGKYEKPGKLFNPAIATMITGAARLVLAMVQKATEDKGGSYAFCDTDSMCIIDPENNHPEVIGPDVVNLFKQLIPYDFGELASPNDSLLEPEDYNFAEFEGNYIDADGKPIHVNKGDYAPLFCYSISSKRYVLYNLVDNGSQYPEIIIRKESLHGLGGLHPPRGLTAEGFAEEIWKRLIRREHGIHPEPLTVFDDIAIGRANVTTPSLFKMFNREQNQPYSKTIKPGNFFVVGYSVQDILNTQLVDEFYCREHHAIGLSRCPNKTECDSKEICLSNHQIIAMAPKNDNKPLEELGWADKATKQSLTVKPNPGTSHPITNEVYLKTYWDFINPYDRQPESKFDGPNGDQCTGKTKGLLQPCHVIATPPKGGREAVVHIGKEANAMDRPIDPEVLPEQNIREDILGYNRPAERKKAHTIDFKQWGELREILKDNAKPRRAWAEKLGMSLIYFKQVLAGAYEPSLELYPKILEVCEVEGIRTPSSKLPIPAAFKDGLESNIHPLSEVVPFLGYSVDEARKVFKEYVFDLYGIDYINTSSQACQSLIESCKQRLAAAGAARKMHEIETLELIGSRYNEATGKPETTALNINNVVKYQVQRKVGKSYKTIRVQMKDDQVYKILKKDNEWLFRLGLLPQPNSIEVNKDNKFERNGMTWYFSGWFRYKSLPWISWEKARQHYKISIKKLWADVEKGVFPAEAVRETNKGTLLINPLTAWKVYGKGA